MAHRRHKLSPRVSRRVFTRGANRLHKSNLPRTVMRGGIRF